MKFISPSQAQFFYTESLSNEESEFYIDTPGIDNHCAAFFNTYKFHVDTIYFRHLNDFFEKHYKELYLRSLTDGYILKGFGTDAYVYGSVQSANAIISVMKITKKENDTLKIRVIPLHYLMGWEPTHPHPYGWYFIGLNPKKQKNHEITLPYEIEIDEEWNKKAIQLSVETGLIAVKTGYETLPGRLSRLYEIGAIKNGDMLAMILDAKFSVYGGSLGTQLGLFKIDYKDLKENYKRQDTADREYLDISSYITDKFCFINKAHL